MNIRKSLSDLLFAGAGICLALVFPGHARALDPDEIAMVVNSNVPQGGELARFYAAQRHIPDNRILVLDLPKADQMSCRDFEDQVVPAVRDFLHTGQLESKVKCLVTFYGVPLRIDPRVNTPEETQEQGSLQKQLLAVPDRIRPAIEAAEAMAKSLNAGFNPDPFGDLDHLMKRRVAAFQEVSTQISAIPDKNRQLELLKQFWHDAEPLVGDYADVQLLQIDSTIPDRDKQLAQAVQKYTDLKAEQLPLEKTPDDPVARQKLREIVLHHFGLLQYVMLLRDQEDYLDPAKSGAAFDSELAMAEWLSYPHRGFIPNPLYYANSARQSQFPTLMVSRLDAPTPDIVKSMIGNSLKVESKGLKGRVVVDSLGVLPGREAPSQAGYGQYDQYLRDLRKILTQRTKLVVAMDEKPEVLPAGSYDDVALYVGWYSVHNYIPCCKFNPGAVGYHIASFELTTLRSPGDNGWVRGLLQDGVVGTLGPVAEPYLGAFPHPDEFFPLLLTGKLTFAEVYWKTCPTVSWMMACVGDPLYTPYSKNPAMVETDLPFHLRKALADPDEPPQ